MVWVSAGGYAVRWRYAGCKDPVPEVADPGCASTNMFPRVQLPEVHNSILVVGWDGQWWFRRTASLGDRVKPVHVSY